MSNLLEVNDIVMMSGDKLMTDSRKVAKHFKKRHGDVLRAYEKLECSEDFSRRNFGLAEYIDAQGKPRRSVEMTKDGFMFLAMGFTGKEAALVKEGFIRAFNVMADQLRNRDLNLWQKMQELIAKEVESKVRASFGSHLMLERKREIPYFRGERSQLESAIQQPLFLN